ncbi:MAG TPA: thioredoxin family protein [Candidatus Poseidoniales archaeon]|nr:MAG TPA: thioredoxin family protein [Candidatus Poseidoniales archaeon]DAC59940.1 MAG TPA: thioredoxin family protein [Candidatus Poseidoniales archaeon]|tara:strand:- start:811 stop:1797 length:987 start_codon:yes stop_codon:yes gene_type:complete
MKELEVFRYDMGGSNSAIAFQRTICLILTAIIMIQLFSQLSHAEVKNYAEDWDEDITITGGRTILVEEISATWCTSCAEIDPFLQQVADAHGSRISIVTYHPTDGEDAFQPEAAKYRIERMKSINSDVGATPSFVVESGELRVGPDSWPDVQKDILKEETSRQEFSKLSFTISKLGQQYSATIGSIELLEVEYETQLTFMLMAHEMEVPDEFFNPGEDYRDRVVIATSSCNLNSNSLSNVGFSNVSGTNCLDDFTVNFPANGKFSLILIHESTDSSVQLNSNYGSTLGVVEFAYRDIEIKNDSNFMPLVFFSLIAIGTILVIYDRKNA